MNGTQCRNTQSCCLNTSMHLPAGGVDRSPPRATGCRSLQFTFSPVLILTSGCFSSVHNPFLQLCLSDKPLPQTVTVKVQKDTIYGLKPKCKTSPLNIIRASSILQSDSGSARQALSLTLSCAASGSWSVWSVGCPQPQRSWRLGSPSFLYIIKRRLFLTSSSHFYSKSHSSRTSHLQYETTKNLSQVKNTIRAFVPWKLVNTSL